MRIQLSNMNGNKQNRGLKGKLISLFCRYTPPNFNRESCPNTKVVIAWKMLVIVSGTQTGRTTVFEICKLTILISKTWTQGKNNNYNEYIGVRIYVCIVMCRCEVDHYTISPTSGIGWLDHECHPSLSWNRRDKIHVSVSSILNVDGSCHVMHSAYCTFLDKNVTV